MGTKHAGLPTLYENRAAAGRGWVGFVLAGRAPNTLAFGAIVEVTAGGRTQRQLVNACVSYLSSSDPRPHFGLGAAEQADRVEIRWPNGETQVLEGVAANQVLEVVQGAK